MASINGITLKSIKTFKDHEGCTIAQGNVYYKGKKLGFWSQDSWGGGDQYDFDEKILKDEVEKYRNSGYVEAKYKDITNLDCLLYDLLGMIGTEKSYKKGLKKGYTTYVEATDGYHVRGYWTCERDISRSTYHKKFLEDCRKDFFKKEEIKVKVYTSIEDFEITAA